MTNHITAGRTEPPSTDTPRHQAPQCLRETRMVDSENVSILSCSDLAMVLLVRAGDSCRAMPTVRLREIGAVVKELSVLGIPAVKVFASGDTRDRTGSRGKAPDSLMAHAIREAKAAHPPVIVMTEACLCSYTDSGECHLIDRTGHPDRQATIEAIAEQAVARPRRGADVIGPAAMISDNVSCVRQPLDDRPPPGPDHAAADFRLAPVRRLPANHGRGPRRPVNAVSSRSIRPDRRPR